MPSVHRGLNTTVVSQNANVYTTAGGNLPSTSLFECRYLYLISLKFTNEDERLFTVFFPLNIQAKDFSNTFTLAEYINTLFSKLNESIIKFAKKHRVLINR